MTKPKMTNVSGSATKTSAKPNSSGFSAITPAPAAPILACAIPVPRAPSPKAIPAPIGIIGSTIFLSTPYAFSVTHVFRALSPLAGSRIHSSLSADSVSVRTFGLPAHCSAVARGLFPNHLGLINKSVLASCGVQSSSPLSFCRSSFERVVLSASALKEL
jgi:hypothetical protein